MKRSARPMKPRPTLRVRLTMSFISGSGYSLTSMIESRKSTACLVTTASSSQSMWAISGT